MKKNIIYLSTLLIIGNLYAQEIYPDLDMVKNGLDIQSEIEDDQGTARFSAMAGSMGALGGDLSAMAVNPAGGGVFIKGNVAFTTNVSANKINTLFDNNPYSDSQTNFSINQVGGILVFNGKDSWKNFNLAFNYSNKKLNKDILINGSDKIKFLDYIDDKGNFDYLYGLYGYNNIIEGYKSKFSLNFSSNYNDNIYLGMNLNFHNASITKYQTLLEYDLDKPNRIYRSHLENTPYNMESNGFSAGFGIIGKVSQMLRLGLAYQTPTWNNNIAQESNYSSDQELDTTNEGNEILLNYSDTKKVTSPGKLILSSALVLSKYLAFNIDYSLKFNEDLNFKDKDRNLNSSSLDVISDTNRFVKDYVKNSSDIKLGAEYRYEKWRFRGGYAYSQSPLKKGIVTDNLDEKYSFNNLLIGDSNLYSAGLGYNFGNFALDFAYQNKTSTYYLPFGGGVHYNTEDRDTQYAALYGDVFNTTSNVAKVKDKLNNFFLTFSWNF